MDEETKVESAPAESVPEAPVESSGGEETEVSEDAPVVPSGPLE